MVAKHPYGHVVGTGKTGEVLTQFSRETEFAFIQKLDQYCIRECFGNTGNLKFHGRTGPFAGYYIGFAFAIYPNQVVVQSPDADDHAWYSGIYEDGIANILPLRYDLIIYNRKIRFTVFFTGNYGKSDDNNYK